MALEQTSVTSPAITDPTTIHYTSCSRPAKDRIDSLFISSQTQQLCRACSTVLALLDNIIECPRQSNIPDRTLRSSRKRYAFVQEGIMEALPRDHETMDSSFCLQYEGRVQFQEQGSTSRVQNAKLVIAATLQPEEYARITTSTPGEHEDLVKVFLAPQSTNNPRDFLNAITFVVTHARIKLQQTIATTNPDATYLRSPVFSFPDHVKHYMHYLRSAYNVPEDQCDSQQQAESDLACYTYLSCHDEMIRRLQLGKKSARNVKVNLWDILTVKPANLPDEDLGPEESERVENFTPDQEEFLSRFGSRFASWLASPVFTEAKSCWHVQDVLSFLLLQTESSLQDPRREWRNAISREAEDETLQASNRDTLLEHAIRDARKVIQEQESFVNLFEAMLKLHLFWLRARAGILDATDDPLWSLRKLAEDESSFTTIEDEEIDDDVIDGEALDDYDDDEGPWSDWIDRALQNLHLVSIHERSLQIAMHYIPTASTQHQNEVDFIKFATLDVVVIEAKRWNNQRDVPAADASDDFWTRLAHVAGKSTSGRPLVMGSVKLASCWLGVEPVVVAPIVWPS